MVGLNLHVYQDHAVLSLDSSGESLHKRGYRSKLIKAPLNEALAAGLICLSGWDKSTAFFDPLCGSGTLPIEAAWIALGRPPALTRKRFGFQGWMDYEVELWTELRDQARAQVAARLASFVGGSDLRRDAIKMAKECARAAGIGHLLHFDVGDVANVAVPPGPPGTVLCNPPYGERIGEEKELRALYRLLGESIRERWQDWNACIFTGNPRLARYIGLEPAEEIKLYNGKIPCRLLKFKVS
jgi:putative N6-adenine-specific DNA methylase